MIAGSCRQARPDDRSAPEAGAGLHPEPVPHAGITDRSPRAFHRSTISAGRDIPRAVGHGLVARQVVPRNEDDPAVRARMSDHHLDWASLDPTHLPHRGPFRVEVVLRAVRPGRPA
jgi:hypothetical protein